MIRKRKIPRRVIAFARELIKQEAELDVHDAMNEKVRHQEFYSVCEDVNQKIIKRFENALPILETEAVVNFRDTIVRMRVIQAKYDGYYLMERQFFVRAGVICGLVFWHQISQNDIRMCSDVFESKNYKFRCIGRIISIPRNVLNVKDFYYKL